MLVKLIAQPDSRLLASDLTHDHEIIAISVVSRTLFRNFIKDHRHFIASSMISATAFWGFICYRGGGGVQKPRPQNLSEDRTIIMKFFLCICGPNNYFQMAEHFLTHLGLTFLVTEAQIQITG